MAFVDTDLINRVRKTL